MTAIPTPLTSVIRAGLYARISHDSEKDELGVRRQLTETERLAGEKGWQVADTYVDNDISAAGPASKAKPRPEFDRLVDDIRAGRLDAIMAWDLDRLTRRPIELEQLMDVCERHGVRHLATVSGTIDVGTGDGMLVARIKGAVAAEEVEKMRKRQLSKQRELADAGEWGGGKRSYGYELGMTGIVADEAEMIREGVRRVLDGETVGSIAVDWNREGIASTTGKQWRTTALRRILRSPRVAGLRVHHGAVVGPAVWPAIIDRATHERVAAVLNPKRRGGPTRQGRHLLTGLLVCGSCGSLLTAGANNGNRSYRCSVVAGAKSGCWMGVKAEWIESVVIDALLGRFSSGLLEVMRSQRTKAVDPADVELIAELEAWMHELHRMLGARELDRAGYNEARAIADADLRAALRRVQRLQTTTVIDGFLDDTAEVSVRWAKAGPAPSDPAGPSSPLRRALLAASIERITLRPAAKRGPGALDDDRVRVVWRH